MSEARGVIELRVDALMQMFNSMDPAPFHSRDLDPSAEEYIVSSSREQPRDRLLHPSGFVEVLRESLLIGGWVAMWRPIEIFLYDWWPIRADARLYDRLSRMPVRIKHAGSDPSDAWRQDWPAACSRP